MRANLPNDLGSNILCSHCQMAYFNPRRLSVRVAVLDIVWLCSDHTANAVAIQPRKRLSGLIEGLCAIVTEPPRVFQFVFCSPCYCGTSLEDEFTRQDRALHRPAIVIAARKDRGGGMKVEARQAMVETQSEPECERGCDGDA